MITSILSFAVHNLSSISRIKLDILAKFKSLFANAYRWTNETLTCLENKLLNNVNSGIKSVKQFVLIFEHTMLTNRNRTVENILGK